MLALFHDKKCCNCFNFVACILWDFIILSLVLSWWRLKLKWRSVHFARNSREGFLRKGHVRSTWLKAEESCQDVNFASISRVSLPMRYPWDFLFGGFLSVTFLPFTHTIYTLITHKLKGGHSERKTLDRFSTIHTHLLKRELPILSEKSL